MPSHLSSPRPVRTYSGRGIGRPRLIPQASRSTNPREDILEAAGRLSGVGDGAGEDGIVEMW